MKRLIYHVWIGLPALAAIFVMGFVIGCGPQTANTPDPQTARSQLSLSLLQRDQELQNAAITANMATPKQLSDADAIAVVKFTTTTADEIQHLPQGWPPVVKQAYANLKLVLASRVTPAMASIFALVDALLAQVN